MSRSWSPLEPQMMSSSAVPSMVPLPVIVHETHGPEFAPTGGELAPTGGELAPAGGEHAETGTSSA